MKHLYRSSRPENPALEECVDELSPGANMRRPSFTTETDVSEENQERNIVFRFEAIYLHHSQSVQYLVRRRFCASYRSHRIQPKLSSIGNLEVTENLRALALIWEAPLPHLHISSVVFLRD